MESSNYSENNNNNLSPETTASFSNASQRITYPNNIIQSPFEKKPSFSMIKILLVFFFVFFSISLLVYFFYIQPRINLFNDSKKLKSFLSPLKTNLKSVDSSLKNIYNAITNNKYKEENRKTLLYLDIDNFLSKLKTINQKAGEVAGVSTFAQTINTSIYDFTTLLKTSYNILKKRNDFGTIKSEVLGETSYPLESERTTKLRQIKEYAKTGANFILEANIYLKNLEDNINTISNKNSHQDFSSVLKNLKNTNKKAEFYLDEAKKIVNYYEQIINIQIKLEPTLTSYYMVINSLAQSSSPDLYIDRIKEIREMIDKINKEIQAISKNDIPDGMESLHDDNLKIVELLQENIKETQNSIEKKDYIGFLTNILNLSQKLEPLATRAISLELSFWQDNKYIRDSDFILTDYNKNEEILQKIIYNNQVPYFTKI